ncbi:gustatory and odorant receptor 21a-like [Cimex lectularius]|uniref:Gustatory receptor n=1 Tax=Cimex lectularius TaxID=79782 RepID=A0A8I6RDC5_CIMLE|nr:gustatory and odorant receptor 21a-like [Cimex lectularius]
MTFLQHLYFQKSNNAFYLEVRPILLLFRIFARMTYDIKDGTLICRPRLIASLAWFILYGAQFYVTIDLLMGLTWHLKQEKNFITSIVMTVTLVFILMHLFLPISLILESDHICSYVNRWADLQVQFYKATGKKFIPKYRKLLYVLLVITPFHEMLAIWISQSVLYYDRWYHLVLYFSTFFVCQLNTLFWAISFFEMAHIASEIKEGLRTNFRSFGGYSNIANLRSLWVSLVDLCADLGRALWRTMIILMIVNFGSSVASVYAIISHFISGSPGIWTFVMVLFCNGTAILLMVEPVHMAMLKAGHGVYQELLEFNVTKLGGTSFVQVDKFLQVVKGINPRVTLGGFFTIDRSLLTTIAGASVTYLIVLIQFRIPSENM